MSNKLLGSVSIAILLVSFGVVIYSDENISEQLNWMMLGILSGVNAVVCKIDEMNDTIKNQTDK